MGAGASRVQEGARAAERDPACSAGSTSRELRRPGANLGAFELPRRMTPKVKVIGRQSRGCVTLIFDLDQHLVSRYWFTAERARLSAPRCAEGAVRLAARQFSTPNRFAGSLSETRLVGHEGFLVIGPKRESRRVPQGPDGGAASPQRPDGRR